MSSWAWKRAAARVSKPVTYLCVQRSYGEREVLGWIPRESAIECGLEITDAYPEECPVIIHINVSERLHRHPLWVTPERWKAAKDARSSPEPAA